MGDGAVRWAGQLTVRVHGPHPGRQSPGKEVAEAGVGLQGQLGLRDIAASSSGEHSIDGELERSGELTGSQPSPASGDHGQGQVGVEEEGEAGGGWDDTVRRGHRSWAGG